MKPQKLYEIFTEALADENIKAELISIIENKTENHIEGQTELFPQSDSSELAAENASLSRKIALLELEAGRLKNENAAVSEQLKRTRETLNSYCSSFAMQISLYEKIKNLSQGTARVLDGIYKNNTLNGIFVCGVLPENLKCLRDYTEQLVINSSDNTSDIATLNELYIYLLGCYNSAFSKPVYKLTSFAAGDEFDENYHHNTATAKFGKIKKIHLQGLIAAGNSKVIRKAVVEL